MAAKEMYDYLSAATADYTGATLSVSPQRVLTEIGSKNHVIHLANDGSEERISFSDDSIFFVTLVWDCITESDAGTIVDFYHSTSKGNGFERTFPWAHPTDGNTYCVRFASELRRQIRVSGHHGFADAIRLKVLGREGSKVLLEQSGFLQTEDGYLITEG